MSSRTSLPDMIRTAFLGRNRLAAYASAPVATFPPVLAYLLMHPLYQGAGQGAWGKEGWLVWAARVIALGCLLVSAPKVYEFMFVALGGRAVQALGWVVLLEGAQFFVTDAWLSGFALAISVAINGISTACAIAVDDATVRARKRKEDVPGTSRGGDTLSLTALASVPEATSRARRARKVVA